MSGARLDWEDVLRSAAGRPRVACGLHGSRCADLAREAGAELVADDATSGEALDLVGIGEGATEPQIAAALERLAPRLADGGHVAIEHGPSVGAGFVREALRRAGLQRLWGHGALTHLRWRLTVARRAPAVRPLSLTVGMISMNEAAAVGPVIDLVRQHCPEAEVLLVDSSQDETPVIAEQRGARVIRQFPPRGYGPAMTRLLYSATTDVIVTMDCDGTYPADQIRAVHERVEHGADLVNATRTHHKPKAMAWSNYLANRTFAATAAVVHRHWTTDLHSGMRAYRTSMLRGVFVPEKGLALPVELLLLPVRHGYRVDEVPIDYFDRIGVTTLNRWKSTVWTFKRIGHVAWTGGVRRG